MLKKIIIIITLLVSISFSGFAQYTEWQKDVTINDISFKKMRYKLHGVDTTAIIAYLSSEQKIEGIPCAEDWIHFSKDWVPELFCLSEAYRLKNLDLPSGTWVLLNPSQEYHVVVFPKDIMIDGHLCRGGGGSKGIRTSFYESGKLRSCFLKKKAIIDGIPCMGGVIYPVIFHESGKLYSSYLSKDFVYNDVEYGKEQKFYLDEDGNVI